MTKLDILMALAPLLVALLPLMAVLLCRRLDNDAHAQHD